MDENTVNQLLSLNSVFLIILITLQNDNTKESLKSSSGNSFENILQTITYGDIFFEFSLFLLKGKFIAF